MTAHNLPPRDSNTPNPPAHVLEVGLHCGAGKDISSAGDGHTEWPSGVGGAQCDDCGRTTIVRATETDMLGNPETWQCRPCAIGDDRFQNDDFQGDDHA